MNSKWCLSTLFLLFTYLGVFHEDITIPNQEIVLEFVDSKIDNEDIEFTISDFKERLKSVGVTNIKIRNSNNGSLKISYFSNVDVDIVREILSNKQQIVLNKNQKEENEQQKNQHDYNINIYEIVDDIDSSNLNDKFTFEIKNYSDRFKNNYTYVSLKNVIAYNNNQLFKTAFKVSKNNYFIKDNNSYNEPEVRAGPTKITS